MALSIASSPVSHVLSKNDITYQLLSTGHGILENYKVRVKVLFARDYDTSNYVLVAELAAHPDEDGKTFFNIKNIIDAELDNLVRAEPPLPPATYNPLNDPAQHTEAKIWRRFKIQYAEHYGSPPSDQAYVDDAEKFGYYGGVDHTRADALTYLTLGINGRAFTNNIVGRNVAPDQPVYISYMNNKSTAANISTVITPYSSETGANMPGIINTYTVPPNKVFILPIGVLQNGIDNNEVYMYTVNLKRGVTSVKNIKIKVDRRPLPWHFDLIYLNGFGVPEVFRVKGERSRTLKVNRKKAINEKGDQYQFDYDINEIINYNSGYLSESEADALQELLVYNHLYEIDPGVAYLPIDLTTSSFSISKTGQFLRDIKFAGVISSKKKIIPLQS